MMKPRGYWGLPPGEKRDKAKAAYCRFYAPIDRLRAQAKQWRLYIPDDVVIDVTRDGALVIGGVELIPRYTRGIVETILAGCRRNVSAAASTTPDTENESNGPPSTDE